MDHAEEKDDLVLVALTLNFVEFMEEVTETAAHEGTGNDDIVESAGVMGEVARGTMGGMIGGGAGVQ